MFISDLAGGRGPSPVLHFIVSAIVALATLVVALTFVATPGRAREAVAFDGRYAPGTIVISQSRRALFYVAAPGSAIRYPVAVGKAGKAWRGYARVDGKYVEPAWSPPPDVKRDNPRIPDVIAGGSPHNPMGARALTLDRGQYAIHGTTRAMRASIGTAASYGCIRMFNEDVIDLFQRASVGALVVMTP